MRITQRYEVGAEQETRFLDISPLSAKEKAQPQELRFFF
jgi:hypothetical protein